MKKVFPLVCFLLLACETAPPDISDVDLNNLGLIGYSVTYSEICGQFSGSGAENQKIDYLAKIFKSDPKFYAGYQTNRDLLPYDGITGLTNCSKAKAIVDAKYLSLSK